MFEGTIADSTAIDALFYHHKYCYLSLIVLRSMELQDCRGSQNIGISISGTSLSVAILVQIVHCNACFVCVAIYFSFASSVPYECAQMLVLWTY